MAWFMGDSTRVVLGCHKLHSEAFLPAYATEDSACFDIRICLPAGRREVDAWTRTNAHSRYMAHVDMSHNMLPYLLLQPGDRVLLPTQLVLDIPRGYSVRLHMRSGLALKGGLMLSNCEGVIDSDYTDQLMIPVTNNTDARVRVNHGDRICQGEIVEKISCTITETADVIKGKTDRIGGFGSTGKA